jgi:hypothetical protein
MPREHKGPRRIRLAPRHTGHRSSSNSPAARHSREQVEGAPPRPQVRAGRSRPRPRRGRRQERRRASGPRRREREGSIVGSWRGSIFGSSDGFLGNASRRRSTYRWGSAAHLTPINSFLLLCARPRQAESRNRQARDWPGTRKDGGAARHRRLTRRSSAATGMRAFRMLPGLTFAAS